ncbi:MAG: DUF2889 domain-containing protein [Burkholderiaceae bacterium]
MPSRRHVHTRSIKVDAYARDDGLWDLEAKLTDHKSRDFKLATGMRPVGEPIHDLLLTVTIDTQCNVVGAQARSLAVPYPEHCGAIEPDYSKLIGLNLLQNFRKLAQERLGGTQGCTHLTELASVLPTVAVQAFAGEVFKSHESPAYQDTKPKQLDRCHALRTDGPAVAQFYPRWARTKVGA